MPTPFLKMNGAGNDFVVIDARFEPIRLTPENVLSICSRSNKITHGCDQVIVMERSKEADVFMRIYNADGGESDACGNATRCIAGLLEAELGRLPVTIQTNAGILQGLKKAYTPEEEEYVLVDMGAPKFDWQQIPLAVESIKAAEIIKQKTGLENPAFVSMGNPHVVFFLKFEPENTSPQDEDPLFSLPFETIGPQLEQMKDVFPEGVNVSIALLRAAKDSEGHIVHARVWERGAGLTKACGTAACAILAAAHARDSFIESAHLWFEPFGSFVTVQINAESHVLLGGPVETEFTGKIEL